MTPLPDVKPADMLDDADWFEQHPDRRYRARPADGGWWLIRLRGGAFLRTYLAAQRGNPPTDDETIAALWFATAWPQLSRSTRRKLAKKAARS